MPRNPSVSPPSYRLHRPSGQAVVTLGDRDVYLGPHGSPSSREAYDRTIAEWLTNGRNLRSATNSLTVAQLILRYFEFAQTYYVKNGRPTSELHCVRLALRPLRRLYGQSSAADFGPLALKSVRQQLVDNGMCRSVVNGAVGRVKRLFRWATENELLPPTAYHGLAAVPGLRRGRTTARDPDPIRPVPEAFVAAVKPHVSRQVWAMIELQTLTGMRPGEVVIMRGVDLDMSGKLWTYRPAAHKCEHHEFMRVIYLGPRAQAVLRPFLRTQMEAFLFSPAEAEDERRVERRTNRRTPLTPSQARRQRKAKPKKTPRAHYEVDSYRRAISWGCDQADAAEKRRLEQPTESERIVPRWGPHRLRHNFATQMRKEHGIEIARILLGHRSIVTTEIYAERDSALAAAVIGRVG